MCTEVITDSLALERAISRRCALVQPLPSSSQLANKRRARFLSDLAVAYAFPPHTGGFTLQVLDLTHTWSDRGDDVIDLKDILALTAAVYMFIERSKGTPARFPNSSLQLQNFSRGTSQMTCYQRRLLFSGNFGLRAFSTLHANGLRSPDAVCRSGNNNCCNRFTLWQSRRPWLCASPCRSPCPVLPFSLGSTAKSEQRLGSGCACFQRSECASAGHCSSRPARETLMARRTSFVLIPQLQCSRMCAGHFLSVLSLFVMKKCSANLLP